MLVVAMKILFTSKRKKLIYSLQEHNLTMYQQPFPTLIEVLTPFILSVAVIIIAFVIRELKAKIRKDRAEAAKDFSVSFDSEYLESFNIIFKDCSNLELFLSKGTNSFAAVLKLNDESKGRIYIGEWITSQTANTNDSTAYVSQEGLIEGTTAKSVTMGVIYDPRFCLPNYTMWPESFGDRVEELIHSNLTKDIDFTEDKEFSDTWWLCSNDSDREVKKLFSLENIRSNSLKLVHKKYRLAGCGNILIIVSQDRIDLENYRNFLSDIRLYQEFMSSNKEFYNINRSW